jgi:hypothetical protein
MWSQQLNNLAASIEDALKVKSAPMPDMRHLAQRLRAAAEGVGHLESCTVADYARVVGAEIREGRYGDNVVGLSRAEEARI